METNRNAFTRQLLSRSEIKKSVRILDVGCGTGKVSFLLEELLGKTVEIIGIDQNKQAILSAQKIQTEKKIKNIQFITAEINQLDQRIQPFDVIVGRRVLMYLENPGNTIKVLKRWLKPSGKMIFQESDSSSTLFPNESMPKHAQAQKWVWDTVANEGGNIHIGSEMYSLFAKAGLDIVDYRAEAVIQTVKTGSDLAWLVKIMAPRIIDMGVATKKELDIENLETDLESEMVNSNNAFIRDMNFGICAINKSRN